MKDKKFRTIVAVIVIFAASLIALKFSGQGIMAKLQGTSSGPAIIPLITIAALLDSLNPCAFSVLLLTIAFLFNMGEKRRKILAIGGTYIFGIFFIYVLIGLGILRSLEFFNIPGFMRKVAAVIIIAFGAIDLLNTYFPNFPIKLKIPKIARHPIAVLMQKGSYIAAFGLGAFVGLVQFPCVGGPYLLILGLLHDAHSYMSGFWLLLFYNLLFLVPLIIVLGIASNPALLTKVQELKSSNTGLMRYLTGLAMIVLGLLIFAL